ncbi:MAG: hypothetical protein GY748_23270 [Planctomycetaceae bacterium]|nr:hypothetical protein [Planctomycetaceae bacterium]
MTSAIEISGLDELEKKLGRLESIEILKKPMTKSVLMVYGETQTYPPKPKDSNYRRKHSGGLAGSWITDVKVRAKTLIGVLGSRISYGPYVMSPRKQAWMHKGRWLTTDDILEKRRGDIVGDFEAAIRKVIDE